MAEATGSSLEEIPEHLLKVKEVVCRWWPEYWPLHEACLSVVATLLLRGVAQSVALVLIGDSGSGKGSILYGYSKSPSVVFRSRFTSASMLSTYGDARKVDLENRALFRQVRHRLFVCSDLNPLLKTGESDSLSRFYADFAVWLDGEGLVYDSGTHGCLGEQGDYTFAMIAGATPFRKKTWKGMAELGPRLLFLRLSKGGTHVPARDYDRARDESGAAVLGFVDWLAESFPVRSTEWRDVSQGTEDLLLRYCELAALGQAFGGGNTEGEDGPVRPTPSHLFQRLSTIIQGHALLHAHQRIEPEDLLLAKWIARSSTPGARGEVLFALSEGEVETQGLMNRTGLSLTSIQYTLDELRRAGVVEQCGLIAQSTPDGVPQRGHPSVIWKLSA